ncbi:uncharacterized protein LOC116137648 [Pistacia vera]|uniref:uncharacterized protein LOC116137648 n=1 Tax=Pistacia vera TaxID=55513 RepID=UPI001263C6A6|nr:uncharacterized protein LOC116137648 [Pistacia vera]XP_031279191.1 uncharacterized protein LOC116137648 [Pistacia vera]
MNEHRAFSSPELVPDNSSSRLEDHSLEGIAANVKLLLKLIQDHNEASTKNQDDRKTQRVAGMITIIDDVKTRIQKSQSVRRTAELWRCFTDLKPNHPPKETKTSELPNDEKDKLRRQLTASLAARKSLEVMCSSLGKEKQIMASELAKKVHELSELEEHVSDLKAQNDTLLAKVQQYAAEHKEKKSNGVEIQGNAALQERTKALSEQLLKSLDGYKSLKRKYQDAKEENVAMRATMEEMGFEVAAGVDQVKGLRQRIATKEEPVNIEAEISALETMFKGFNMKIGKHIKNKSESSKSRAQASGRKP